MKFGDQLSIALQTPEGKPLQELERLIVQRQQYLGETAKDAVVASTIDVLVSVRSLTRVANPKDMGGVTVAAMPTLVAGWRTLGKGGKRVRCVRRGGAHGDFVPNFVNLMGPYVKGENPLVFRVKEFYSRKIDKGNSNEKGTYLVVAYSLEHAREYAKKRHERRVKRYAGMAKWTIGQAMKKVSTRNGADVRVEAVARRTGLSALTVNKLFRGKYAFAIHLIDDLRYATPAIKGGATGVKLAMMRASNKVAGIIRSDWRATEFFNTAATKVKTPFEELIKGR